jgi:hypothetical protein
VPGNARGAACPAKPPRTERMNILAASAGSVEAFAQKLSQVPSSRRYCSMKTMKTWVQLGFIVLAISFAVVTAGQTEAEEVDLRPDVLIRLR